MFEEMQDQIRCLQNTFTTIIQDKIAEALLAKEEKDKADKEKQDRDKNQQPSQ